MVLHAKANDDIEAEKEKPPAPASEEIESLHDPLVDALYDEVKQEVN